MALEEGCPVKFRVVLPLVPGLFYVKCLQTKNVPRVLRPFARTRIRNAQRRELLLYVRIDMEHVEHVEQGMFSIDKAFHVFERRGTEIEQNWTAAKSGRVCENAGGYCLDAVIAREIPTVEREDMPNPVNSHRCDKAGIVYLNAQNTIFHNQSSPLKMSCPAAVQQTEVFFNQASSGIRLGNGQTIAVFLRWARARVPKLGQILGRVENVVTCNPEMLNGRPDKRIVCVIVFHEPEQDICIDKVGCHSAAVLIEAFTREARRRQ
jgi:hypothetical protein